MAEGSGKMELAKKDTDRREETLAKMNSKGNQREIERGFHARVPRKGTMGGGNAREIYPV